MIRIAPSVLAADFSRLTDQLAQAEAGGADWFHLDVMDGHFVPNITFGPLIVSAIRKVTRLPLDTHLMIASPDTFIRQFRDAGADHIIVHQEVCTNLHRTVVRIRELGAKPGVSINPDTPASTLSSIISDIDLVLMMSVYPGFGGQKFIEGTIDRIKEVRALIQRTGRDVRIEVDGGIDVTTGPTVVRAGADVLVAGTAIFRRPDIAQAVRDLRKSVEQISAE
ncbi:MAG: ribulose-phosphate 3-epimerase [Ignavibacteria bacterium]|nr:ribulose-phosphate 3-epimerase [Ignavibacteria bacterium]